MSRAKVVRREKATEKTNSGFKCVELGILVKVEVIADPVSSSLVLGDQVHDEQRINRVHDCVPNTTERGQIGSCLGQGLVLEHTFVSWLVGRARRG